MPDTKTHESAPPSRARSGKRRRVTAGTLEQLRRELWYAIRRVSALLDDESASPELVIKAANAIALVGNAFTKVTETAVIEAQVREIEEDIKLLKQERGMSGWRA